MVLIRLFFNETFLFLLFKLKDEESNENKRKFR